VSLGGTPPCPNSSVLLRVVAAVTGECILEMPHCQACKLLSSDLRAIVAESQTIPVGCVILVYDGAVISSEVSLRTLWLHDEDLTVQFAVAPEDPPKSNTLDSAPCPRKRHSICCGYCLTSWAEEDNCMEILWRFVNLMNILLLAFIFCIFSNCKRTQGLWKTALGGRKCFDRDAAFFTTCCPSVICCIIVPFGVSIGLFVGDILPGPLAFSFFWVAAGLTCCCWPGFATYHVEELQGDYDEGTGLEGCYLHTGCIWCCILVVVCVSIVLCVILPQ